MIVAHRGASKDAPENTLAAFRLAWEQGADAIETDLRLTSDGVLVCCHDETTGRMADRDLNVARSTLADLRELDLGDGQRIPTLDEVLATIPEGGGLYAEIKCGPEALTSLRAQASEAGLSSERLVVISFSQEVVSAAGEQMPQCRTMLLVDVGRIEGSGEHLLAEVLNRLEDSGATGVSCGGCSELRSWLGEALTERGVEWHVWTVDDPADAATYLRLGASSITTNVPMHIRENLVVPGVSVRAQRMMWGCLVAVAALFLSLFRSVGRLRRAGRATSRQGGSDDV